MRSRSPPQFLLQSMLTLCLPWISLPVAASKDASTSLAYILTNKAYPPLIPGTCSSPGTHNTIRSPEADRQGWAGMLVASLLPGQMARLLGGEEASWRGVTALQRAQSSREQKCWQLLLHLPESTEAALPRKVCVFTSSIDMVFPVRLIEIKDRETQSKHCRQKRGFDSTYLLENDGKSTT